MRASMRVVSLNQKRDSRKWTPVSATIALPLLSREPFSLRKARGRRGRGERIRTSDPLLPKQMRYQAALHPEDAGKGCDIRLWPFPQLNKAARGGLSRGDASA